MCITGFSTTMKLWKNIKYWLSYRPPYGLHTIERFEFDQEFKRKAPVRFFINEIRIEVTHWLIVFHRRMTGVPPVE